MKIISIILFFILLSGLTISVAGLEITSGQAYMGWPVMITGTHPYGEAEQDIFIAVYPGYSGAALLPGPERSGAELEAFIKTEEEGKWSYQFIPNSVPGEYLIYADVIGTTHHETLLLPILYCSTTFIEPIIEPTQEPVLPQSDPTEIPTLTDVEVATPLSLFPIAFSVLGGLGIVVQRRRTSAKP